MGIVNTSMMHRLLISLNRYRKTDPDTALAYISKLPAEIKVAWNREKDGTIVGKVTTDDNRKLITYGYNAIEFIEMVNDAVLTAYDIPLAYRTKYFSRAYLPGEEDRQRLFEGKVDQATVALRKNTEDFVAA